MENKRSKSRAKVSEKRKPSQAIPFEQFFSDAVRLGKLKDWQRKEIYAFFKDLKLREKEELAVYEEALAKF